MISTEQGLTGLLAGALGMVLASAAFAASTPRFVGQQPFNGYYAEYEVQVTVPEPTPGHNVSCATSVSQPSPEASDEYFITSVDDPANTYWDAIHNKTNHGYRKVFVCPGDYHAQGRYGGGDGNELQLRDATPTAADPLYIVWWNGGDRTTHPAGMSRPTAPGQSGISWAWLPRVELHGVSHYILDRTTHAGRPAEPTAIQPVGSTSDILFNRVLIRPTLVANGDGFTAGGGIARITIQNSVVGPCGFAPEKDDVGVVAGNAADDIHVVNNEIYDCTDLVTGSCLACSSSGIIIENNDLYFTPDSYASLNGEAGVDESPRFPDANGDYMCRENAIDLKGISGGSAPEDWIQILHNRVWGGKPGFAGGSACTCGSSGAYVNNAVQWWGDYVVAKDNIIFDYKAGAIDSQSKPESSPEFASIVGNVLYNIGNSDHRAAGSAGICGNTQTPVRSAALNLAVHDRFEVLFNTIIDIPAPAGTGSTAWLDLHGDTSDIDFECNLAINAGPESGASPATGWIDRNAFIGTPEYSVTDGTAHNDVAALTTRAPSTAYAVGDWVRPSNRACAAPSDPGCFAYVATAAGTSAGGDDPAWPTTLGMAVDDGDVTWVAALGPLVFSRRRWTGPSTYVIPAAVPASGIPGLDTCRGHTVGARGGYGVDDSIATYP